MKAAISILKPFAAYMILALGTLFMLTMIIDYSSFRTDIHFLLLKQEYLPNGLWRTAFYVHVFTSIIVLASGFTQFSKYILKNHRQLHRVVGKIYVGLILLVNFPSGMILAVYANGLLPTKIAFIILDTLWFLFTLRAFIAIRSGRVTEHKEFMIRSFALTFSAITLRTWKIILFNTFHLDPLPLYMIDAWMGFVPNLLFAEWLIRTRRQKKKPSGLSFETKGKSEKRIYSGHGEDR